MNIWDILAALRLVSKPVANPKTNIEPAQPNQVPDPNKTPNPDDPAQAPLADAAEPARHVRQQVIAAKIQLDEVPVFDRTQELRLFTFFDRIFSPKSTYGVRPSKDELTALRSFFQESSVNESGSTEPLAINLERAIKDQKLNILLHSFFSHEMNYLDQIKAIGRSSGTGNITRETMRDVYDIANEYASAKRGQRVYLVLNNSITGSNCIFDISTNLSHALYVVGQGKGLGAFGERLRTDSPNGYADYCRDQYHLWRHSQARTPRHPHGHESKDNKKHDLYTGRRISYSLDDLISLIEFQTADHSGLSGKVSAYLTNETAANILLQNEKPKDDSMPDLERITVHDFRDLMDEYN